MPTKAHVRYATVSSVFAMVMAANAAPSFAQEAAPAVVPSSQSSDDDGGSIGDIVVTAQKREQRLQDVGLSVTALSAETLANKRITTLADIAQAVPGLIYTQSQTGTPVYTLRGVGFFESSLAAYPDVSTYIDQVPLPLPTTATLTAFDLDRVEVLRGPQGTLFGNNATGGAINFIAAKPTDHFVAGGSIGYGRFNTFSADGYVGGPLSDTVRARASFKIVKGDDWQKSYTRDATTGKTDTAAARLLIDWDASDRLKVSLNINGWLDRSDPTSPQFVKLTPQNPAGTPGIGGVVPADLPILNYPLAPRNARATDFNTTFPPRANDRLWQTAARADYEIIDGMMLTSITSYLDTRLRKDLEYDGTALEAYDIVNKTGRIKSFSQELRLANDGSNGIRWVVGGNFESTKVGESSLNLSGDSSSALINGFTQALFSSRQQMKNYAGFGNIEYKITPDITLKGGVRYTQANRTTVSSNAQDPNYPEPGALGVTQFFNIVWGSLGFIYPNYRPITVGQSFVLDNRLGPDGLPLDPSTYGTAGLFRGSLKENNTSWSVGVDYKVDPDILLYANVSQGYKAGSFPDVAAATWSQFQSIKQESLLDYEAGFKAQFANRTITVNGAAFYYDYQDKQLRAKIVDGIFGLLDGLVNVPKSRVKGAELSVNMRPVRGLTVNMSGTYLDAKVRSYNGIVAAATDPATGLRVPVRQSYAGARLPFSPKIQLGADFLYEMPLTETLGGFFGADVSAQSKSYAVLAATAQDKQDFTVPKRALFGVNAGIQAPDASWRLAFWGKNIFNKYYTLNTILSYDTLIRYAGRPAEYGVSLSFKM